MSQKLECPMPIFYHSVKALLPALRLCRVQQQVYVLDVKLRTGKEI